MKITFRARIRSFLAKHGAATIDQVVAAVGKHVTATQALRCWERSRKARHYATQKKLLQAQKLASGTRRVVMEALCRMRTIGWLKSRRKGVYELAA